MASKKNVTNNFVVNQPVTMLARANPTVYLTTSTSFGIPSHPYGTKRKI